jgi:glyoxylase-like metal-dependent hydrolase (beta-lactamase superfamily II)
MLQVKNFIFNEFQENTYVIWDQTKSCAIIDPGCYKSKEQTQLADFIAENGLKPALLLNTHCHIDHVLGNDYVMAKYNLPLHLHKEELLTYSETKKWTAMFGISPLEVPADIIFLEPKSPISFGDTILEVLFTPGHSIASLSFFHKASLQLFAGDVLFKQSIGRTDLPGGNLSILLKSIKEQLLVLPDETIVYAGHNESTTIGEERRNNPFLRNL